MFWGILMLGFLALLVIVKMLTVLESRSQEIKYRNNTRRIQELMEDLETSRAKYLIAVKAEGVSKHKLGSLKTWWQTSSKTWSRSKSRVPNARNVGRKNSS